MAVPNSLLTLLAFIIDWWVAATFRVDQEKIAKNEFDAGSGEGEASERRIMLDNAAHVGHTDDKVLVFFKSVPHVVTPDNMDTVIFVSSMLR